MNILMMSKVGGIVHVSVRLPRYLTNEGLLLIERIGDKLTVEVTLKLSIIKLSI